MKIKNLAINALILSAIVNTTHAQEINLELGESKNVRVVCPNKEDKRVLSYDATQDRWCDITVPGFCKHRQLDAARRVCKKQYAVALKNLPVDPNFNTEPTETLSLSSELSQSYSARADRERRKLESELLDIQGKRLGVSRKILTLEKKEMALKASIRDF